VMGQGTDQVTDQGWPPKGAPPKRH
jgi:hypothetical protein